MAQYPFISFRYGPATLVYGTATASGLTTIGTPPTNSDLRLLLLDIPENATTGTAGENLISVLLNGSIIFSQSVYMGTTGGGTGGALYQRDIHFNTLNFNANGGNLEVQIQTTLTAGLVQINAYFD